MKIISFDIGIKNLALCILEINSHNQIINIPKWTVLDVTQKHNVSNKCNMCEKPAIWHKQIGVKGENVPLNNMYHFCKHHAKLSDKYEIPSIKYRKENVLKLKLSELKSLDILNTSCVKKRDLLDAYNQYYDKHFFEQIQNKVNCNKINIIDVGRNIQSQLDMLFTEHDMVDVCLIENQLGPMAVRMKTIQGMVCQYFINRNVKTIEFISSSNKLKDFTKGKTTYKERKELSIQIMKEQLLNMQNEGLKTHFNNHNKKDDLADCYLQGLWWIKHGKY